MRVSLLVLLILWPSLCFSDEGPCVALKTGTRWEFKVTRTTESSGISIKRTETVEAFIRPPEAKDPKGFHGLRWKEFETEVLVWVRAAGKLLEVKEATHCGAFIAVDFSKPLTVVDKGTKVGSISTGTSVHVGKAEKVDTALGPCQTIPVTIRVKQIGVTLEKVVWYDPVKGPVKMVVSRAADDEKVLSVYELTKWTAPRASK